MTAAGRRAACLLVAAAALATISGSVLADTVAQKVFAADPMRGIKAPTKLEYRFEMRGATFDKPYVSEAEVDVRKVQPDGTKEVWLDMFEGANHRHLGPVAASDQNPLVLVFLQRDVNEMHNLTGGAAGYFQAQIRRAFNEDADTEKVEVGEAGAKRPALRLTIHPFRHDPNIEEFPKFKEKAYAFTVADWVPGGIWRLAASTPDPSDGHLILEESVTFDHVAP